MSKGIRLSKKHGVNPSLLKCIMCGESIGVALMGRLKDDAEAPSECINGDICDKCNERMGDEYVGLVEARQEDGQTRLLGRSVFVRKTVLKNIDPKQKIFFCDSGMMDKLIEGYRQIEKDSKEE